MEAVGFCVVGSFPKDGLLKIPFVGGQLHDIATELTAAS
jgi:hypothetical protein